MFDTYFVVLLDQCFSIFKGSRHPLGLKNAWRHPTMPKMTKLGTPSRKLVFIYSYMLFQYLAALLAPPHGTLVCRGTLVGNHWSRRVLLYQCAAVP